MVHVKKVPKTVCSVALHDVRVLLETAKTLGRVC